MTLTDEWVEKAEGDYHLAAVANRLKKRPEPDGVCYHCQQCAEKYLKAYLIAEGVTPERTHDLEELVQQCATYDPGLIALMSEANALNQYSVRIRYPGLSATVVQAQNALQIIRRLRRTLRRKLGL